VKIIKTLLKIIVGLLIFLVVAFFVLKMIFSKPLPESVKGPEAEQMAQKMLAAINYTAFDTLPYASWTFAGKNHYVWDKTDNTARISWDNIEVHLDMDEVKGKVYENGTEVIGPATAKLVDLAWKNWCNDSFWFNAPSKIMDPGTERSVVTDEDGTQSLMITYASGGYTPGDSYLWHMDANGLPTSYEMWTQIIPFGGVSATWENWTELPNGAKISSFHKIGGMMPLPIDNIKGGFTWQEMGFEGDPIRI